MRRWIFPLCVCLSWNENPVSADREKVRGRETSQACELAEITLGEHLQVCFLKKKKGKRKERGRKEGRKGKDKKKKVEWICDRMWEGEQPIIPWPFPFSLEILSCENLIIVLKMKFYQQGDLLYQMIPNEEWYRMQSPSWSPSRLTERGCSRLLPG